MCQNKVAALVVSASSQFKLYVHNMYLINSKLNMPTKNGDRIMGDVRNDVGDFRIISCPSPKICMLGHGENYPSKSSFRVRSCDTTAVHPDYLCLHVS